MTLGGLLKYFELLMGLDCLWIHLNKCQTERVNRGNKAKGRAVPYLPKIPGSTVYAVYRPNIDVTRIIEHILISLSLIGQEDDIS